MLDEVSLSIKEILDALCSESRLTTTITYRKFVSTAFDRNAGTNVDVFSDSDGIVAIKLEHSLRSATEAVGAVQAGWPVYIIRYADAPSGMSLKDQIVDDGKTLKVAAIERLLDAAYAVTCEGSTI